MLTHLCRLNVTSQVSKIQLSVVKWNNPVPFIREFPYRKESHSGMNFTQYYLPSTWFWSGVSSFEVEVSSASPSSKQSVFSL